MADTNSKLLMGIAETAINIGYSCQLLTDDMVDIFIVDGQSEEEVELQLLKCRDSLRGYTRNQIHTAISDIRYRLIRHSIPRETESDDADVRSDRGYSSSLGGDIEDMGVMGLSDDESNTGYALVINGHSLVHALQPKLEKIFLDIGTQCMALPAPFPVLICLFVVSIS